MARVSHRALLGVLALLLLVGLARADVSAEAELPDNLKPAPLDETEGAPPPLPEDGFVDPRSLPPPEAGENFEKLRAALQEMAQAQDCEAAFGTPIGDVHGVTAYSNCNDKHISMEDHVYTAPVPGHGGAVTVVTGMKWQCVEFARRYLLKKYGVLFGDVMGAVDIWRFTSVHKYGDPAARLHLGRYRNHDDADRWPVPGSLVIWPIQKDMPFGHVAVVAEVVPLTEDETRAAAEENEFEKPGAKKKRKGDGDVARRVAKVRIGDQNYQSSEWKNDGYTRELYLETFDGEYFAIADPAGYRTFGWMTYESDIKPLDYLLHDDDEPGLPKAVTSAEAVPKFKTDKDDDGPIRGGE